MFLHENSKKIVLFRFRSFFRTIDYFRFFFKHLDFRKKVIPFHQGILPTCCKPQMQRKNKKIKRLKMLLRKCDEHLHIASIVRPLQDTLRTSNAWWKIDAVLENSLLFAIPNNVFVVVGICNFQWVSVEAFLGSFRTWIVIWTQRYFEVSLMIRRQVDFNINRLFTSIRKRHDH